MQSHSDADDLHASQVMSNASSASPDLRRKSTLGREFRLPDKKRTRSPERQAAGKYIWIVCLCCSGPEEEVPRVPAEERGRGRRTITCDRTGMSINSGSGEPLRIEYTDVLEHRETPHLYLLLCSGHMGVQLARDGLTTGSWNALLKAIDRAKEEAAAMQDLI